MTTNTTNPTDAQVVQDLQSALSSLTSLLGGNSILTLKAVWNYLQVYSTWCERLPNNESTLNTVLDITDPGSYDFYQAMLTAYQSTSTAGNYFLNTVFPNVIGLGNDLLNFATTAGQSAKEGGIFSTIKQQMDAITPTTTSAEANNIIQTNVLPLLQALQQMADQNATDASNVTSQLSTYKSDLQTAQSQLQTVDTQISNDASVSQTEINKLEGGADVMGSLAQLEALKKSEQAAYQEDVTIASTTPTYAWVCYGPIPVGLIAAAVVAGVYGARAIEMLKLVHATEDQLATAQQQLQTSIAVHAVQSTAKTGVDSAVSYTAQAITQTTTLQNNWNTVSSNLTAIQSELNNTTFGHGSDKLAYSKIIINVWLNEATTKWNNMIPLVNALMQNPYITVLPGNTSASQLLLQCTA